MIQYRFKIGVNTNRVWLENDEEANEFSKFIDANWERDTMIVKLQQDNKFCTFELELGDIKNAIWPDVDHCWIVNGVVYQADANFVNNFFVKKIHDTGIFIGSHPSTD